MSDWKPATERIITARFQGYAHNVTIIQCYAPTEAAEIHIKQSFYAPLQEVYNKTKKKDIAIVMGDLNAQVVNDNLGFEEVMGKHGHRRRNEHGELFIEWCAANEMVIGGTLIPHK
jgi:exonuclease III